MAAIRKIPITPQYRKDNGLFVLEIGQADAPFGFAVTERSAICIPPEQQAGNHSHPRSEAFICIGPDVELHWLDKAGKHHTEIMNPNNQFFIFIIPPHVPHAVRNNSAVQPAILIEYASGPQSLEDIAPANVLIN